MSDAIAWTVVVVMALFVGAITVVAFNDIFRREDEDDDR